MTEKQDLDGLPALKTLALPALAVAGTPEAVSLAALLVNLAAGNNQPANSRSPAFRHPGRWITSGTAGDPYA